MFFIFFFLNITILNAIIVAKYAKQTTAEKVTFIPSNKGNSPNRYCVKSQFIVIKNLIKSILYDATNEFIMLLDIYPRKAIVMAKALFVNIVLHANAIVDIKM